MRAPQNRVLIVGVGNASGGDDALAPRLLQWLRESPHAEHWWLNVIEDAQLQIEHALDLQISDLALFVGAGSDAPPPCELREVNTPEGHRIIPMNEILSPEDVLHTLTTVGRRQAPPSFALAIRGEQFEPGQPLSSAGAEHLDAAVNLIDALLDHADADAWRALAGGGS